MQLSYMHPQQLSLLSSKLIKQMPPYPTFYKEQHVIDSSLGRRGGRERDFILTLSSWYFFFFPSVCKKKKKRRKKATAKPGSTS